MNDKVQDQWDGPEVEPELYTGPLAIGFVFSVFIVAAAVFLLFL